MAYQTISRAALQRLPVYMTYLRSLPEDRTNISATAVAAALNLGEVQVRKDLSAVCGEGKPKIGYPVKELIRCLGSFLDYDDLSDGVVVGTGRLGRALLDYTGFEEYGLRVVAGFDIDDALAGKTERGKPIFPLSRFEELCARLHTQIGVLCVPADCAQAVCDLMVRSGFRAILNFAPVHLAVPEGVELQNENIAADLASLANRLRQSL